MNTNPKVMTVKNATIITDFLNLKLANLTDGLNYWGREDNKIDNSLLRMNECKGNILELKAAYNEIYSMFIQLKTDFNNMDNTGFFRENTCTNCFVHK